MIRVVQICRKNTFAIVTAAFILCGGILIAVVRTRSYDTIPVSAHAVTPLKRQEYPLPAGYEDAIGTPWPHGLTPLQVKTIRECDVVYVLLLDARDSRPDYYQFHDHALTRVVSVKEVRRLSEQFLDSVTPDPFRIFDSGGGYRFGMRFVDFGPDGLPDQRDEVVDLCFGEAYCTVFVYSESDLRHVIIERPFFEVLRKVLDDRVQPGHDFSYTVDVDN
ncbi:MAG: hypothetical protein JNL58_21405 [Planctomyces sp.]|nr:hypothetical protein [Planctomyces sp.]